MKKRILALTLAMAAAASLTGCGNGTQGSAGSANSAGSADSAAGSSSGTDPLVLTVNLTVGTSDP